VVSRLRESIQTGGAEDWLLFQGVTYRRSCWQFQTIHAAGGFFFCQAWKVSKLEAQTEAGRSWWLRRVMPMLKGFAVPLRMRRRNHNAVAPDRKSNPGHACQA
jgi:hypothetical protein